MQQQPVGPARRWLKSESLLCLVRGGSVTASAVLILAGGRTTHANDNAIMCNAVAAFPRPSASPKGKRQAGMRLCYGQV